ncbi:PhzF family phenazine biosynthesis protein [Carboxylicivirga mesophila]|uniref:PhzF family phenazine biosynthesis protein n=1 Tax=Carboxylicivirga mesophila TaxID=1166478 RepID=A0ABS5KBD2_9BACT|nr:PhzF family phenazine biosynthesis protein [Carboxylicivirga mesophila]MBS2212290.1 PhzF family phenazine biosynthesis protein [Carboxylicivirga mesophila]
MKLTIYQIDAFTDKVFGGNPACVVPLEDWLPDELLLKIAMENAVAETAFFVKKEDRYHLRWFTPDIEMDLCGHATLAAAYVLKVHLEHACSNMVFETISGQLEVKCDRDVFILDFPSRPAQRETLPKAIKEAINIQPDAVLKARDYVLVYPSESMVMNLQIDRNTFDRINLGTGGVIATSKGSNCDFVSRFFTPQATILEDPVTGSAHCTLVPYWSQQLNKKELTAFQVSERRGILYCKDLDERVLISGRARTYMVGHIWIE